MIDRRLHWYDLFLLSIYFLGLVTVGQTNGLVFPLLVQDDIGPAQQASYLGTLRLGMLMVALLTQAIWGLLSDHTYSRWGRRKPYILFSGLTGLVLLLAIIPAANINGTAGFWVLFAIVLALATVLNAGQAGAAEPDPRPGAARAARGIFQHESNPRAAAPLAAGGTDHRQAGRERHDPRRAAPCRWNIDPDYGVKPAAA